MLSLFLEEIWQDHWMKNKHLADTKKTVQSDRQHHDGMCTTTTERIKSEGEEGSSDLKSRRMSEDNAGSSSVMEESASAGAMGT